MNFSSQISSLPAHSTDAPVDVMAIIGEDGARVRELLVEEIASRCGLPSGEVAVISSPGRGPGVRIGGRMSSQWHASFSYTRGCVAGVVSFGTKIGVDVEWIDPDLKWPPIAEEFFPSEVIASWPGLPPDEARQKFFWQWVRWEAALKCRGTGFGRSHLPCETAIGGLKLVDLNPSGNHAGCVALNLGGTQAFHHQHWTDIPKGIPARR
jgi:hypothetical protein